MDRNRQTATARRGRMVSNNPVEALRIAETGDVFWLPSDEGEWTIGADAGCDLIIDEPHVSRVHCTVARHDGTTVVTDKNSKNGTMLDGVRCDRGEIVDGSAISLGESRLVAVSRETQHVHDSLRQLLGWGLGELERIDAAVAMAKTHAHLLVMGEPGTEPERLAKLIHDSSLRRHRRFVVLAEGLETARTQQVLLESAAGGTLYADLGVLPERRERFIDHLLDDDFAARFIGGASGRADAVKALGVDLASQMMGIRVPSLRTRIDDLPRLVVLALREICHDAGTAPILTEADLAALRDYGWPKNMAELRRALKYIAALSVHGSSRAAADALQVPRSTLKNRLRRIGLDDAPRPLRPLSHG